MGLVFGMRGVCVFAVLLLLQSICVAQKPRVVGESVCGYADANQDIRDAQTYASIGELLADGNWSATLGSGEHTSVTTSTTSVSPATPLYPTTGVTTVSGRQARYWAVLYNVSRRITVVADGSLFKQSAWQASWDPITHNLSWSNDSYPSAPVCYTLQWEESQTLSLFGAEQVWPEGTVASTTVLIAKVAQAGIPQSGVPLRFTVDVKPNSGGHEHAHDATREKGTLTPSEGVTNVNGELAIKFQAPKAAGIHTIKATCPSCSNKEVSKEIQVKVPGLIELGADTGKSPEYALAGAISGKHTSNHWFTPKARDTLLYVSNLMYETGWGQVGINDGSLASMMAA